MLWYIVSADCAGGGVVELTLDDAAAMAERVGKPGMVVQVHEWNNVTSKKGNLLYTYVFAKNVMVRMHHPSGNTRTINRE